jgi:sulfatase maturation enzyme AslB (radical SAM superfamily)
VISISTLYCGGAEDLRALRYGPAGGRHRKEGLAFSPDRKPIVVWNCTRRCNLRCMHCYSQSADCQAGYEMSGEEAETLLRQVTAALEAIHRSLQTGNTEEVPAPPQEIQALYARS